MPFITSSVTKNTITVPTDTLDNILPVEIIPELTLVKIDIEGAELLAMKGAISLLKQQRPHVWIMEINDAVNNFGYQKQDLVSFLQEYGYSLYTYNPVKNQVYAITLEQ